MINSPINLTSGFNDLSLAENACTIRIADGVISKQGIPFKPDKYIKNKLLLALIQSGEDQYYIVGRIKHEKRLHEDFLFEEYFPKRLVSISYIAEVWIMPEKASE